MDGEPDGSLSLKLVCSTKCSVQVEADKSLAQGTLDKAVLPWHPSCCSPAAGWHDGDADPHW